MKLSCTQENLYRGVSLLSQVVAKGGGLPILNNILFQTENGLLYLSATNLEIGVKYQVRGKIDQDGTFTVPAKVLNDLVANLPNEKLDLNVSGNVMEISSNDNKTKLRGLSADDFPVIPWPERKEKAVVSLIAFKKAIEQTLYASALDDTRPELNGVLFRFKEELVLAATDGYRLSESKLAYQDNQGVSGQRIVPLKTCQTVLRLLPDDPESKLEIYVSQNQILFVAPGIEIVSRLVNGNFPDYEQIIPTVSETEATISIDRLTHLVKIASLFCRPGINDIKLEFQANGKVLVAAANEQIGENQGEGQGKITGQPVTVVFNYRYLLDALQRVGSDEAVFNIVNSQAPVVFYPAKNNKETAIHRALIMPIKQ
ncbi:MAG: DNA polymerase III subunit beta [bacterium]